MRCYYSLLCAIGMCSISCKKSVDVDQPKSKIDYLPIVTASTPRNVAVGERITSRVTMGFNNYFADITFLNFEVTEKLRTQYEIRAKAFYDNILYGYDLPVISTFDTILVLQPDTRGDYLLRFYNLSSLVEVDTVTVN
jgi:hypothetical protein